MLLLWYRSIETTITMIEVAVKETKKKKKRKKKKKKHVVCGVVSVNPKITLCLLCHIYTYIYNIIYYILYIYVCMYICAR